ncbi:MAG: helix-turn-helix transcriptional regulator [Gemmatimonadetes bacterium]|nr:helix-turn-helix transcriptional regulator [Gemmatimonadota bacterium]
MTIPSALVREARQRAGLSQKELAERAGTSQPAIARIESGRGSVTLATLTRMVAAAGFELVMELSPGGVDDAVIAAYRRDVDRSLLRHNLQRSVDERLRAGAEMVTAGHELSRAVRTAAGRSGRPK